IRFMNQQFVGNSTFYVPDDKLERIVTKIDADIKLPFRKLTQMFIMSGYEFSKFVEIANQYAVGSSVCSTDLSENDEENSDVVTDEEIVDNEEGENDEENSVNVITDGEKTIVDSEKGKNGEDICVEEKNEVDITLRKIKEIVNHDRI